MLTISLALLKYMTIIVMIDMKIQHSFYDHTKVLLRILHIITY